MTQLSPTVAAELDRVRAKMLPIGVGMAKSRLAELAGGALCDAWIYAVFAPNRIGVDGRPHPERPRIEACALYVVPALALIVGAHRNGGEGARALAARIERARVDASMALPRPLAKKYAGAIEALRASGRAALVEIDDDEDEFAACLSSLADLRGLPGAARALDVAWAKRRRRGETARASRSGKADDAAAEITALAAAADDDAFIAAAAAVAKKLRMTKVRAAAQAAVVDDVFIEYDEKAPPRREREIVAALGIKRAKGWEYFVTWDGGDGVVGRRKTDTVSYFVEREEVARFRFRRDLRSVYSLDDDGNVVRTTVSRRAG